MPILLWIWLGTAHASGDDLEALERACDLAGMASFVTDQRAAEDSLSSVRKIWLERVEARLAYYRATQDPRQAPEARTRLDAAAGPSDADKAGFAGSWRRSRELEVQGIEALAEADPEAARVASEGFASQGMFDCDEDRAQRLASVADLLEMHASMAEAVEADDLARALLLADQLRAHPAFGPADVEQLDQLDPRGPAERALRDQRFSDALQELDEVAATLSDAPPSLYHWVDSRRQRAYHGLATQRGDRRAAQAALDGYAALPGITQEDRGWIAQQQSPSRSPGGWTARGQLALSSGGMFRWRDPTAGSAVAAGVVGGFEVRAPRLLELTLGVRIPDLLLRLGPASPTGSAPPTTEGLLGVGFVLVEDAGPVSRLSLRVHGVGALLPTHDGDGDSLLLAGSPELGVSMDLFDDRLSVLLAGGSSGLLSSARAEVGVVVPGRGVVRARFGIDLGYLGGRPSCDCTLVDEDWFWVGATAGLAFR